MLRSSIPYGGDAKNEMVTVVEISDVQGSRRKVEESNLQTLRQSAVT
jgi:hypothetical protein